MRGTTEWATRDGRNGYIDQVTQKAISKLFENHHKNGINFEKYFDIPMEISEDGIPQMLNFSDCEVHPELLKNLQKFDYHKPTPVQQYAIPVSLLRRDLMACAQTGSGKTAAYLYPLVAKMLQDGPPPPVSQRTARPVSLILAPTRELSVQIYEEALKFTYMTGIRVVVVYGGAPVGEQERKLVDGADLIIATPGRLIDFIDRQVINLYLVRYLILDEADRMLDMGFEPQLIKVLTAIKKVDRETIMCSATFPQEIQNIARKYLRDFVKLSVGRVGSTTENITQKLFLVRHREKEDFLISLLCELQGQILIFVEKKITANDLTAYLNRQGVKCACIHGDRVQAEREKALNDFKNSYTKILIATDVASRGLDIPNVAYVIIYDLPSSIDSYVHRIGRTGRIGNTGIALTLVEDRPVPVLSDLLTVLKESHQEIPQWFYDLMSGKYLSNEAYSVVSSGTGMGDQYRGDRYGHASHSANSGAPGHSNYSGYPGHSANPPYKSPAGYGGYENRPGYNRQGGDNHRQPDRSEPQGWGEEPGYGDSQSRPGRGYGGQNWNTGRQDYGGSRPGYNQAGGAQAYKDDAGWGQGGKSYESKDNPSDPSRGRGYDQGYNQGYNQRGRGSRGYQGYNSGQQDRYNQGGQDRYNPGYQPAGRGGPSGASNPSGSGGYSGGYQGASGYQGGQGASGYQGGQGGYRGGQGRGYQDYRSGGGYNPSYNDSRPQGGRGGGGRYNDAPRGNYTSSHDSFKPEAAPPRAQNFAEDPWAADNTMETGNPVTGNAGRNPVKLENDDPWAAGDTGNSNFNDYGKSNLDGPRNDKRTGETDRFAPQGNYGNVPPAPVYDSSGDPWADPWASGVEESKAPPPPPPPAQNPPEDDDPWS